MLFFHQELKKLSNLVTLGPTTYVDDVVEKETKFFLNFLTVFSFVVFHGPSGCLKQILA